MDVSWVVVIVTIVLAISILALLLIRSALSKYTRKNEQEMENQGSFHIGHDHYVKDFSVDTMFEYPKRRKK